MGLQQFKIKTANTVISGDNASLQSMATDQIFDLFSLDPNPAEGSSSDAAGGGSSADQGKSGKRSVRALLEGMPELWDEKQYDNEYDINAYMSKNSKK